MRALRMRPHGQDEFLKQGWLRASQRALDPTRFSVPRPYQAHQEGDVAVRRVSGSVSHRR